MMQVLIFGLGIIELEGWLSSYKIEEALGGTFFGAKKDRKLV